MHRSRKLLGVRSSDRYQNQATFLYFPLVTLVFDKTKPTFRKIENNVVLPSEKQTFSVGDHLAMTKNVEYGPEIRTLSSSRKYMSNKTLITVLSPILKRFGSITKKFCCAQKSYLNEQGMSALTFGIHRDYPSVGVIRRGAGFRFMRKT